MGGNLPMGDPNLGGILSIGMGLICTSNFRQRSMGHIGSLRYSGATISITGEDARWAQTCGLEDNVGHETDSEVKYKQGLLCFFNVEAYQIE